MAGELDGQVAGKTIATLDDDRLDAIASDPLEHGQEAGALGHRIGAADCRISQVSSRAISGRSE
jgi:hypothetical protein